MPTQSIIVYHSPLEAAIWESGLVVPLAGGLGIGCLIFIGGMMILDEFTKKSWKKPKWWAVSAWALAIASLALAGYVFHTLAN